VISFRIKIETAFPDIVPRMTTLILKKTASHYGGDWSDNDYVVLDGGKVIGRIMLHPQAPQGQPWFWTITALDRKPSAYDRGYSATRQEAMTAFKTQWVERT
jgi:hypothetical protein